MIVLSGRDIVEKPIECDTAVALGSFDAVHIGHTEIIKKAVEYARFNNVKALVYLFEKAPKAIMNNDILVVNTLKKRLKIMEELGADYVVVESFTKDYRQITYQEFVNNYIVKFLNAKFVSVGFNFRFGFNCEGNSDILTKLCEKRGIKTHIQKCISFDNVVSTTYIRNLILNGEMEKCTKYLGRKFTVCGNVVHGKELGRTIGFPTANIEIPNECAVPKDGVYITETTVLGKRYSSITNIGGKPTVDEYSTNIETYITDFSDMIYDLEIEVAFLKKIRDIKKFDSLHSLSIQLEKDKAEALEYLKISDLAREDL